jgi:hypothetical protein
MNASRLNVFRIDERVFTFMVALVVLSSIILAFRYKTADKCEPVNIDSNAAEYIEGSLIFFKAGVQNAKSFSWDFGDGNKVHNAVATIQHAYRSPGEYLVTVEVNGHCEAIKMIKILPAPVVVNTSIKPDFIAPAVVKLNEPVSFEDTTADAVDWEWRFGENESIYDKNRKTTYTFTTPGQHIVILRINGRSDRVSSKQIYVEDERPVLSKNEIKVLPKKNMYPKIEMPIAPQTQPRKRDSIAAPKLETKAQPVKAPPLEADEMIIFIQGIVTGEKKSTDALPYFCGEPDIPVTYNGMKMKFSQMCNELKKIGKLNRITTPEVRLMKQNSTNCIKGMDVTVGKRSKIDRILGRKD